MRRLLLLFLGIALLGPLSYAQNLTNVTATVVDPNGTVYIYGTYSITFYNPNVQQPLYGGIPLQPSQMSYTGQLDVNGNLSVKLPSNALITPSGTQWTFKICANGAQISMFYPPPPLPCFSSTQTISGSSQVVTFTAAIIPTYSQAGSLTMDTIPQGIHFIKLPWAEGPYPIVSNGNFETQGAYGGSILPPPGWFPDVGITASYETVAPCEGAQSLKAVFPPDPTGFEITETTFFHAAAPGDIFYLGAIAKSDGVVTAQVRMTFLDKTNTGIGVDPAATTASASCTPISVTATAPAGTVYVIIHLSITPTAGGGTAWYDAINLYRVSYPALTSQTANPSQTGFIRLANLDAIKSRNAGNSLDLSLLFLDATNQVNLGDANAQPYLPNPTLTGGPGTAGGTWSLATAAAPVGGNGGDLSLAASNSGGGGSHTGGNVQLKPGNGSGGGTNGVITLGAGTTVALLPAAASFPGAYVYVTDSTAIGAEGQTCVGSSTNKALAFSNGVVWKCF